MRPEDDELEGALFEAFGRENQSVLEAIDRLHGTSARVLLRQPEEDSEPVVGGFFTKTLHILFRIRFGCLVLGVLFVDFHL